MDVILAATDALRQMLDNLEETGEEGDVETESIIETIESLLKGEIPTSSVEESGSSKGDSEDKGYLLTINSPEHLNDFLEEVEDNIENLNKLLVDIEKEPERSEEIIQDIFRYFHNLKGNSGLIGYKEFYDLTHKAESLLNYFRQNKEKIPSDILDLLLKTLDLLEEMVDAIDQESGLVTPPDLKGLPQELEKVISRLTGSKESEESAADKGLDEGAEEALEEGMHVDDEDLSIFLETVRQQFENIKLALGTLEKEPDNKEYIDGLYRAFISLKNACEYMELDECAKYADQTAVLVDQGRNMEGGFDTLLSILSQESEILEEMINKEIEKLTKSQVEKISEKQDEDVGSQQEIKEQPEVKKKKRLKNLKLSSPTIRKENKIKINHKSLKKN